MSDDTREIILVLIRGFKLIVKLLEGMAKK